MISDAPNYIAGRVDANGHKLFASNAYDVTHEGGGVYTITVNGDHDGGDAVLLLNQTGKSSDYIDSAYLLRTNGSNSFQIATTVGGGYKAARNFNFVLLLSDFSYEISADPVCAGYQHGYRKGTCLLGKSVDYYGPAGPYSDRAQPPSFFQRSDNPDLDMPYLKVVKPDYDGTKTTEFEFNAYKLVLTDAYYALDGVQDGINPRMFDPLWNQAFFMCPIAHSVSGGPTNGAVISNEKTVDSYAARVGINALGPTDSSGLRHFDHCGAFQCAVLADRPTSEWQLEHRWIWGTYRDRVEPETEGLSWERKGAGMYRATFDTPYDHTPVVVATVRAQEDYVEKALVYEVAKSGFTIVTTDKNFEAADRDFHYLVCPVT